MFAGKHRLARQDSPGNSTSQPTDPPDDGSSPSAPSGGDGSGGTDGSSDGSTPPPTSANSSTPSSPVSPISAPVSPSPPPTAPPSSPSGPSQSPPSSASDDISTSTSASLTSSAGATLTSATSPTVDTDSSTSLSTPSSTPTPASSPTPSTTPPPTSPTTPTDSSSTTPATTSSPSFSPTNTAQNAAESVQTTITSTIVTSVSGHLTTIITQIPTTLSSAPSTTSDSSNRAVIIGSVVGASAFVALLVSLFIFCKRRKVRKMSFFGQHEPKPRAMLFAGEDMDDVGGIQQYRDYPASYTSHSHAHSPLTPPDSFDPLRMVHTRTPSASVHSRDAHSPSPHLLGMRASESGSIFQEAVWPPPGEASRLVDPLTLGSNQVSLHNIVDDVMGPSTSSVNHIPAQSARPPIAHERSMFAEVEYADPPPSAMHSRATSQTALLGERERETGSPTSLRRASPLFVTNMGPASPTSPSTPPVTSKGWLERLPKENVEAESSEGGVGLAL